MKIEFGNVGVCVEGYTKESLYALLEKHSLDALMGERYLRDSKPLDQNMYLQSDRLGPYQKRNTINIRGGFVHFVTDMENFLLILRVGILDQDAANGLVEELFLQGLINPRNYHETN